MRDLLLFTVFAMVLPFALYFPAAAVLVWSWIAFMSPHREVFGAAFNFQFNLIIAVVALIAWLGSREPKRLPAQVGPFLVILFAIWVSITTYFAINPAHSFTSWDTTIKTLALVIAVLGVMTTKARIQALVWIMVVSLGYYAIKGGGFVLLTGGGAKVFGPDNTHIGDNNHLGLALVMTIPLIDYLRRTSHNWLVNLGAIAMMALTVIAVVGTYSRGGFIALLATGFVYWLRAPNKIVIALGAVGLFCLLPSIVAPEWFERMATIEGYEQDLSVQGRFAAWEASWNLALDRPIVGGGFQATQIDEVFLAYNSIREDIGGTAAHSIYFQVLGDHGFVGLAIYLLLIFTAAWNTLVITHLAKRDPELDWASLLARMLQVSFFAMFTAGAFLSMAYYDVFLVLIALTMVLRELVERTVRGAAESEGGYRPRNRRLRLRPASER